VHNKDVRTSLFLELPPLASNNKSAISMDIITMHVTSIDMGQILKKFPKKILLQKLSPLLNDPDRDWKFPDLAFMSKHLVDMKNIII
jgi:hypothetical protein